MLRRAIHTSAPKTNPSNLLASTSQYTSLSVQSLRSECRKKGLKVSGRKAELIDRLASYELSASWATGSSSAAGSQKTNMSTVATPKRKTKAKKQPSNTLSTSSRADIHATLPRKLQATSQTAAKGDTSPIDYYRLPGASYYIEEYTPPFKIPVPPDSSAEPKEIETEYQTPKPDGGYSEASPLADTNAGPKLSVVDTGNVRSLEDEHVASGATLPDGHEFDGSYQQGSAGGDGGPSPELNSRDRGFLTAFAGVVAGWWALGSLGKSKKKKDHS